MWTDQSIILISPMLGPQLEFIFTKCLQKEKNIFF